MKFKSYLFALLTVVSLISCNSSGEESEERLTATINGEEWEFFDINVSRTDQDVLEIRAQGYLEGDRGAVPVSLMMSVVGVPLEGRVETPYEAYFAPNTQEVAAHATIQPEDQPEVFDTHLDVNSEGRLVITESTENTISGEFNFIASDKAGRRLEVTDGKFNNIPTN